MWEGTLVSPGEYDWTSASLGPPESTTQRANWLVQPFLHSSRQKVPILYNEWPFSPKLPLLVGWSTPHLIHDSLSPSQPTNQTVSPSVQLFLHRWPQSVRILYNGTPFPLKIAHLHGGIWTTPSNTWFPGTTQVLNPNGISTGSAVLAKLTSVTDRPTDWQTTLLSR